MAGAHTLPPAGPDQSVLRLLADPLRARIDALLAAEQLCTCHLVELTGAKQTNFSDHLRALRDAGIVTASPYGRFTTSPARAVSPARTGDSAL